VNKKVILYVAVSLDGFIARKNGSVDWLDKFNSPEEDYGYKEFLDSVNTVIMGNATYKQTLTFGEFPYKNKNCFVFAKTAKDDEYVKFVNDDVNRFINKLSSAENQRIWLVGGENLVNQFLQYDLIDEFIISIIPVLLGEGIQLFNGNNGELSLVVKDSKSYNSGVIQIHYERKRA
jgi:dihydrofolate reductase